MFMREQKIDKVKVMHMKEEIVLTYITWNKKESSYINNISLQMQKMKLH